MFAPDRIFSPKAKGPLSQLVEQHDRKRAENKVALERCKQEAMQKTQELSRGLLSALNNDVAQVHMNQHEVNRQVKLLQKETASFVRQTSQWLEMNAALNKKLEALGDVETWARNMEVDLRTVASALEYVCEAERRV